MLELCVDQEKPILHVSNCTTLLYDAGDGVEYNIIGKSPDDISSKVSEEFFRTKYFF